MFFPSFFKVVQALILQKYPRRSCGSFWSSLELWRPTFDRFRLIFRFISMSFCVFLRNGDGHGNGYDHDCCGSTTTAITTLTMVTIAATWWLRPRLRQLGGYDHGNGYDHDCRGSTTTAITTLTMVTIAATATTTTAAAQRRRRLRR